MADNPFEPKRYGLLTALGAEPRRHSLFDWVGPPAPTPEVSPMTRAFADLLMENRPPTHPSASGLSNKFGSLASSTPTPPSSNAFAGLISSPAPFFSPPSSPPSSFGPLADLIAPPQPPVYTSPKPKAVAPETKRKAFFSFHFDDIMRVNNVRNSWKITHPNSTLNRSFYDSSLWESRKLVDPEAIKQLIRSGVLRTSAVCVLAGSMTWDRRWVKYEIARAIIDGRGLLTVHLNSINHHQTKGPHPRGLNPLAHMGIAKLQPNKRLTPQYYLYEMKLVADGFGGVIEQWTPYKDYTLSVRKPAWLSDPDVDHVIPLSIDAAEYDYELGLGNRNIGSWIDKAARQAGR